MGIPAARAWASMTASVLLLSACSMQGAHDGYLTLTAGEATLTACPSAGPVAVETLRTSALPTCDPVGQVLVFPDGEQLQLSEQQGGGGASSSATSSYWYAYEDVGNWGLVAARSDSECSEVLEWGNPEALRRVHEAFGTGWACR